MIIDTIATGEVKTVNLVDRKGTVMIDVMATMIGNDTRVVTEIIKAATADDRTTITTAATTTGRILIPLPDAQREVAPGHGEIQSHARVVTNLLVVDTEAEIDQDHTGIHVAGKIGPEVGTEVLLRFIPVTGLKAHGRLHHVVHVAADLLKDSLVFTDVSGPAICHIV